MQRKYEINYVSVILCIGILLYSIKVPYDLYQNFALILFLILALHNHNRRDIIIALVLLCLSTGILCKHVDSYLNQTYTISNDCRAYIAVSDSNVTVHDGKKVSGIFTITQTLINDRWNTLDGHTHAMISITDSKIKNISYGDCFVILGAPNEVKTGRNPNAFDYGSYLRDNHVCLQHHVSSSDYVRVESKVIHSMIHKCNTIRDKLNGLLLNHVRHDQSVKSMLSAFILGDKTNLDKDIKQAYQQTGVMHILAVSGLHVGILFGTVMMLMSLVFTSKKYDIIKYVVVSIVLVIYALITGLSSSVLRAAIMCIIYMVCRLLRTNGIPYNVVSISSIIILVYSPDSIYSVSFQLSYLAVIGILFFYKRVCRIFEFKNTIMHKLWMVTSVSISAQIATLPLTTYYFHQIPMYSLVANMLIIPTSTIIFPMGLLVMVLGRVSLYWTRIGVVYKIVSSLLYDIVNGLNDIILWINTLPYNCIQNVYINKHSLCTYYLIILVVCIFIKTRNSKYLITSLLAGIYWITYSSIQDYNALSQRKLILYSVYPHWAIGYINGIRCVIVHPEILSTDTQLFKQQILPFMLANRVSTIKYCQTNKQFFSIDGKTFAVLNSVKLANTLHRIKTQGPKIDYLVLDRKTAHITPMLDAHKVIINSNGYYKNPDCTRITLPPAYIENIKY